MGADLASPLPPTGGRTQELAVGDLHVENFGTWRDAEGRLIWGVNDFDEAHELPYTNDLVHLAVSATLAIEGGQLQVTQRAACEAILEGYTRSVDAGGRPYVLEEQNAWLRQIAMGELRNPVHFWNKLDSLPQVKGTPAKDAVRAITKLMPSKIVLRKIANRRAGLGSLGRVRLVAIAECRGAHIAREAKAMVPSASYWASGKRGTLKSTYKTIIHRAVRCPDPFVGVDGKWIVRRLSPHCCELELADISAHHDQLKLLEAMGWETANIHLGTEDAAGEIKRHLRKQAASWLLNGTREMAKAVEADWQVWKESRRRDHHAAAHK